LVCSVLVSQAARLLLRTRTPPAAAVRAAFATETRKVEQAAPSQSMATATTLPAVHPAPTDGTLEMGYKHHHLDMVDNRGDKSNRTINYLVMGTGRFMYAAAARVLVLKLLYSWTASAEVMAMSTVEYDVSALGPGDAVTIKWRGKPIFIRHLTGDEVAQVHAEDTGAMRHPETHTDRVQREEWAVMLGVCTHLGCVPITKAGEWNGWFCPCHGSHYDPSGRIMKGPAPENMEIPPYQFMDDNMLLIG